MWPSWYSRTMDGSNDKVGMSLFKAIDNLKAIFSAHKKTLIDQQVHNGISCDVDSKTEISNSNSEFNVVQGSKYMLKVIVPSDCILLP